MKLVRWWKRRRFNKFHKPIGIAVSGDMVFLDTRTGKVRNYPKELA